LKSFASWVGSMRSSGLLCLWLILAAPAFAAIDTYEFDDSSLRERFNALNFELRCPKCQNQNLAGSDAPIAADLRGEIYRLLKEGKSDAEIKHFLVERYGTYVLYRPPLERKTLLLWSLPAILLLVGFFAVARIGMRRRSTGQSSVQLTAEEQARLDNLFQRKNS